jgi:anthranilate synthase
MNLGDQEYLIAASPEMFVRVEGRRVETCPISGTIARTGDVLADSERILELLNSEKDLNELTMCTDVDRNDKSRVCDPASIRVIGRRQIETYSRLFHTVDHVEGTLLPQFDAIDAFLSHTWAVTVTGAPKLWAMRFIEQHEKTQRRWYGGAIGALYFNGNANTGLTLRTIRVKDGVAEVRAGATLLIDSDPTAEEQETRTKASALLDAVRRPDSEPSPLEGQSEEVGDFVGKRILLIDHEDSFVHTLAGYLRRTGAEVQTVRVPRGRKLDLDILQHFRPHLLVLSPGPGIPEDFNLSHTLQLADDAKLPVFGVCLGLQGIVEHFGGKLDTLAYPAHGRTSRITVTGGKLFDGLPTSFDAGRYHSLCADVATLPDVLESTAITDDGVVMAIEHRERPISAVQFHPESLMTMSDDVGMRLINNAMRTLLSRR